MGAAAMTDARGGLSGAAGFATGGVGCAAGRVTVVSLPDDWATGGVACSCEAGRIAEITAVSRPASGTIRTRTRLLPAA